MLKRRGDQGQAVAEYLGVLVVVVGLVAALLTGSGIAPIVRDATKSQVCAVLNDPTCAPPGSLPADRLLPAPDPVEAVRTYPGNPDTAEHSTVDFLAGFVRGAASQLGDVARGLADSVVWGWRSLISHEQRVENGLLWNQIREHPVEAFQAILDGITEPVMAEWDAGRPGAALGRAATEILATVLGPRGLHRLRALNWADETGALRFATLPTRVAAAELLRTSARVGAAAIKNDAYHRAPAFVVDEVAHHGQVFAMVGDDGVERLLVQMPGEVNGRAGVFEWIVGEEGVTHELFRPRAVVGDRP